MIIALEKEIKELKMANNILKNEHMYFTSFSNDCKQYEEFLQLNYFKSQY